MRKNSSFKSVRLSVFIHPTRGVPVVFDKSTTRRGVLRSETHLSTNHEPQEPVGRDEEINRIVKALKPLPRGEVPENLLVHGPAGVGKTTCVRHVFNQLAEETSTEAIYINCWQYDTRSSLLTELLIEMGYPVPRKGRPVDEILSRLQEFVDKSRGGVAVALDEFDRLEDRTEVAYDLQLLSEETDERLGIVMVSNESPQNIQLDPRSESRLSCRTLGFDPYSKAQLLEILKDRVEQAFRPGAVDSEVVERIAEEVASTGGDCRKALGRLLQVGRWADRNGVEEVTVELLEQHTP